MHCIGISESLRYTKSVKLGKSPLIEDPVRPFRKHKVFGTHYPTRTFVGLAYLPYGSRQERISTHCTG